MPRSIRTIDEYLATVAPDRRVALQRLRKVLRRILPGAKECIRYGMPAFGFEGAVVGGFAATAEGCSYYPFSGTALDTVATEIEGYSRTKSALHFSPSRPLPVALVRKLVRARIAEIRR